MTKNKSKELAEAEAQRDSAHAVWKRAEADAEYERYKAWDAGRKAKVARDKWRAAKAAVKAAKQGSGDI